MFDAAILIFFPALMAYAASSDLFTMTISNRISIALVIGFLGFAAATGMPLQTVGMHLLCGLAILVITFTLFAFGWIGGGDAKLAAATAVWLGWALVLDYGAISAVLGGGLTLLIVFLRKHPAPRWAIESDWMSRLHDNRNGVPYGIALAAAGLMLYPQTAVWTAAVAAS
ncbi:MAG: prepilin peptidase [Methylobacteriaceae bacterium]|nr:prepilin peptidase [Methylobacteriaceae bacterium]